MIGGASHWFRIRADSPGLLQLDTFGSSIDTVLATYTGTDLLSLNLVASDNNGAPDGIRSLVRFPVQATEEYFVAVDGVDGATGLIQLNWQVSPASVIRLGLLSSPSPGLLHLRLQSDLRQALLLQASTNLRDWQGISTNLLPGATWDYYDLQTGAYPFRFYRAKTWP